MTARNANHEADVDPVTGYDTTGHDWNGIRELNTPFPRIVLWALALTFAYSVVAWVLLPTWPLGRDYTRGLLRLDQGEVAVEGYRDISASRSGWIDRFAAEDFDSLSANTALMERAMPAASRLFADNCAACHGAGATGGPGFPNLTDGYWLWGGDPETIAETLRVGINSAHPDSRVAEMPAFGRDEMLSRDELGKVRDYLRTLSSGKAASDSPGTGIFADNCAVCHGDNGVGGLENGAPSLADKTWIYGGDSETIWQTLQNGRRGVMPAWQGRLSEAEIRLLALYLTRLGGANGQKEAAK
jgi:cytochrome c oxidase cbb3-type subunit 3